MSDLLDPTCLREAGVGDPVLLLHGGSGPDSLVTLFEHLGRTHHVLLPTHPGWEGTPRPSELDSVTRLAQYYVDFLDSRADAPVTIIGSSFGGWVAAEVALLLPAPTAALVLIDSIGIRPGPAHRSALTSAPPPRPSATSQQARAMAAIQGYSGPDMWDDTLALRLAAMQRPTLVMWGEHDPVLNTTYGRALAAAIPDARFTVIPDAAHLPMNEQPDPTFQALDAFLVATEQTRAHQ